MYRLILQAPAGGFDSVSMIFLFAIFFAAMYFFSIRPQQKRAKEQRDFVENLKKGDKVIINAGIHGKVFKIEDQEVLLEIDTNLKMRVDKSAISAELSAPLNKVKEISEKTA